MASDLAALIERLREAKEGSRELDGLIMVSADPEMNTASRHQASLPCGAPENTIDRDSLWHAPAYTTDLSAAVALCERALPGWQWSIRKKSTNPDFFEGLVTQAAWSYAADRFKASHDCAPLALCIAILRAKASAHD